MALGTGSPGALPVFLTSFVGRSVELDEVADLLGAHRLLTVSGAGGIGKTRLACEVLTTARDRWTDGVRWVGLESVADSARLADSSRRPLVYLSTPEPGPDGGGSRPAGPPTGPLSRQLRASS